MSLHPENNPRYWPLLLTEELYLLPEDLKKKPLEQQFAAPLQPSEPAEPKTSTTVSATAKDVEDTSQAISKQPIAQSDLIWGSLERGVLVLVEYPDHQLLDRPDGLFLVDILKAVGFEFKEVATLNVSRCQSAADWEKVRRLSWKYAISFGVEHPELPFTIQNPHYKIVNIGEQQILPAEKLSLIRADVSRKKQLWNLLKQAFV